MTVTFWYKHCFGANTVLWWSTASNFPKFSLSIPYGGVSTRGICVHVKPNAFIAHPRRLDFWVLHNHSYLLLYTLLWCKHGTDVIDSVEVSLISIVGPIRRCMNPGNLPARKAQCVYCTDEAITFLGSAERQLPFDINIALVQTRYRVVRQPRTFPNFHCRPYAAVYEPG